MRIWDLATGDAVAAPFIGHWDAILSISFSPNGNWIASGSADPIHEKTTNTAFLINHVISHEAFPTGGAARREPSLRAGGRGPKACNTLRIWDSQTGSVVADPLEHGSPVLLSVAFSPDRKRLVSGSDAVRVWDPQTGSLLAGPFIGHKDLVSSVALSPDGRHIVSGSWDHTLRVWDADIGLSVSEKLLRPIDIVRSIAFLPDGGRIQVFAAGDGTVQLWDLKTGTLIAGPFSGTGGISSVSVSADGKQVACNSYGISQIWNFETGAVVTKMGEGDGWVFSAFLPNGDRIVIGGDKIFKIFDLETGYLISGPFEGYDGEISFVVFSPDGRRIVSASLHDVQIWDVKTALTVANINVFMLDLAFSPEGARIVGGLVDATVRIWEAQTGVLVAGPFIGHTGSVRSVAFSPDGRRIASGSTDSTSVTFSPDGARIVSGSELTIRVWELNDDTSDGQGNHPHFKDGWITDSLSNHILWIPPWLRDGLYLPWNPLVIRAGGTTKLDMAQFVHGTNWHKCIDLNFAEVSE
ncbi:quinon protein alcohol dehydrogenase-like superfamily [Mycena capillaripes]|nr:quinon protein alcohol dehydrogenase-like superfamily [Mycena capillaripes]